MILGALQRRKCSFSLEFQTLNIKDPTIVSVWPCGSCSGHVTEPWGRGPCKSCGLILSQPTNSHESQVESPRNQTVLFSNTNQSHRALISPVRMAIVMAAKNRGCRQGPRGQRAHTPLVGCKSAQLLQRSMRTLQKMAALSTVGSMVPFWGCAQRTWNHTSGLSALLGLLQHFPQ